jgi:hypothetical protein
MRDESFFARTTLEAYALYADLADRETDPVLKEILGDLTETLREQFDFWARKTGVRGDMALVSYFERYKMRILRQLFGTRYLAHYILKRKEKKVEEYLSFCKTCTTPEDQQTIRSFVERIRTIEDRLKNIA